MVSWPYLDAAHVALRFETLSERCRHAYYLLSRYVPTDRFRSSPAVPAGYSKCDARGWPVRRLLRVGLVLTPAGRALYSEWCRPCCRGIQDPDRSWIVDGWKEKGSPMRLRDRGK